MHHNKEASPMPRPFKNTMALTLRLLWKWGWTMFSFLERSECTEKALQKPQTYLKRTTYLKRSQQIPQTYLQQNNAVTLPRPFILLVAVFSSGPQRVYAWKNPCRNLKHNPKHVLQSHLKHTAKTTYLKLRPCQDLLIYGSAMLQIKRWTHGKNSAQTWTNASQTHPRRQANNSKAP